MKRSSVILVLVAVLAAGLLTIVILGLSYHHVSVVDGIAYEPLGHAYISVTLATGEVVEVGQANEEGELGFWIAPWTFPRHICAAYLFFPPNCVNAFSLGRQRIDLAVP